MLYPGIVWLNKQTKESLIFVSVKPIKEKLCFSSESICLWFSKFAFKLLLSLVPIWSVTIGDGRRHGLCHVPDIWEHSKRCLGRSATHDLNDRRVELDSTFPTVTTTPTNTDFNGNACLGRSATITDILLFLLNHVSVIAQWELRCLFNTAILFALPPALQV